MNFTQKSLLSLFLIFCFVVPSAVSAQSEVPEIIKDKKWNRWTSDNFEILSLSNLQGKYLKDNLNNVKKWVFTRWGLEDISFDVPVRLWCIDDKVLFKTIYPSLEKSKVEVRRSEDGKIKSIEAFVLLNDLPSRVLPEPVTEICLNLYEEKYNVKFGLWAHKGITLLNGSEKQIRKVLQDLNPYLENKEEVFQATTLVETSKASYDQLSDKDKKLFDNECMVLCLFLRKEFGQDRMHLFLKAKDKKEAINTIYYYKSLKQFDDNFYIYMKDLTKDSIDGLTPSEYLLIRKAELK